VPRFFKLLRQANDAEIADVRLLGEDQYEVTPHRTEMGMQRRATPEATTTTAADGTITTTPAAAIRFRGGVRAATGASSVPMVGVINLSPVGVVTLDAPAVTPSVDTTAKPAKSAPAPAAKPAKPAKPAAKAKATPAPKAAKVAKAAAKPVAKPAVKAKAAVKKAAPKKK
jgi:hypothetical protein